MRNRLPLDVCNKVAEAVRNTIPGLLEHSINPLRDLAEEQAQINCNTMLIQTVKEMPGRIHRDISDTIPGLLDYAINPLRQIAERQTHEYMVNSTMLVRKMDEISQRVHQDINTAFQSMRLEHSQAQISCSNLEEALGKNAGELRIVGATIADLLETYSETRNDTTSAGRQALIKTLGRKLAGILGSCMFLKFCGCYLRLVLIVLTVSVSLQRRFMSYSASYGI
jgi:hypothetical protein